ncbi:MAG: hypothetical protein WDO13_02195 [Verrucomicrobiota bacterium]
MQFLADVFVTCPVCEGKRFQAPLLKIPYRGKNVHEVLEMTVDEARQHFDPAAPDLDKTQVRLHGKIAAKLGLLSEVGLGYLRLGQPLNQLSGGEAQRIKLLRYLSDEPVVENADEVSDDGEVVRAGSARAGRAESAIGFGQNHPPLHPGRTDDRPSFRGHPAAARRPAAAR